MKYYSLYAVFLSLILPGFCCGVPDAVAQTINGRNVVLDGGGSILPWYHPLPSRAYDHMIDLSVEFLRNDVPRELGYPMYYCRPAHHRDPPHPGQDWFTNPADVLAGFIHSYALDYYGYTGETDLRDETIAFAQYMINEGSTPVGMGWAWAGCPYQQEHWAVLPPRATDRGGAVMPHIIGKLGEQYLALYKATEDPLFLTAAVRCADGLADNIRPGGPGQSPWPWRVMPETNEVYGNIWLNGTHVREGENEYCGDITGALALFDNLIAMGMTGGGRYTSARTTAWNWLVSADGPLETHHWVNYFEDQPYDYTNQCQISCGETARYIIRNRETIPSWETYVQSIFTDMLNYFSEEHYGATTMNEQYLWFYPHVSHTARYAGVCALYYEASGNAAYREEAYRSFNWTTYASCPEKERVIITIMDDIWAWFTDSHGDYIQHIFTGLGSVPEWAPDLENHLLRSDSVIQSIQYASDHIAYTTYDPASVEVLRITGKPTSVTVNGTLLLERTDLNAPGWTWEPFNSGGALRIRHDASRNIDIVFRQLPAESVAGILVILAALGWLCWNSGKR